MHPRLVEVEVYRQRADTESKEELRCSDRYGAGSDTSLPDP